MCIHCIHCRLCCIIDYMYTIYTHTHTHTHIYIYIYIYWLYSFPSYLDVISSILCNDIDCDKYDVEDDYYVDNYDDYKSYDDTFEYIHIL